MLLGVSSNPPRLGLIAKFRRITGVKRATFDKMVEILRKGYAEKHQRRGRTPKLSIEDLLLATLEYLREYRIYAHIAASYGIAESNIYRGIKWVEDTLIRGWKLFFTWSESAAEM